MRNLYPIFKKEVRSYLSSPIAYVVWGIFLGVSGYFFYNIFALFNMVSYQAMDNPSIARNLNVTEQVVRPMFGNMSIILLFMTPMLTMRLFAEERKSGTLELLMTYPVKDLEVILGKFSACMVLVLLMLGFTAVYPSILIITGNPEVGTIISGYMGLVLLSAAFVSLGIWFSSLTENQIIAAVLSFGSLLIFWILGWAIEMAGGKASIFFSHISVFEHVQNFSKGVIELRDIVYYLMFAFTFLFMTATTLQSWKWRG